MDSSRKNMVERTCAFRATIYFSIFFLIISTPTGVDAIEISDIHEFLEISNFVVHNIAKVCDLISNDIKIDISPVISCKEDDIFKTLKDINDNIESLKIQMNGIETLSNMVSAIPDSLHYELKLNELWDYIRNVDIMYKQMQLYVADKTKYENYTLEEYSRSVLSHHPNSIINLVDKIHEALMGNSSLDGKGFLELQVYKQSKIDKNVFCSLKVSQQRFLLSLYHIISLAELKGYTMIQFSYMLLKLYNKGNFIIESELARKKYEANRLQGLNMMIKIASNSSREFWVCDPEIHKPDITYLEITELLQGYIQNEIDLNSEGGCWDECATYQNTKTYGCTENLFCKQQRKCRGTILNCNFIDSRSVICPANRRGNRRYHSVQYENGKTFGRNNDCPGNKFDVNSWWIYLAWQCSYCACLCDDSGPNSDRYINMLPSLSNIKNNMVVTGLRFTKQNRIIHLQIQEGKLLPNDNIDQESLAWVPVNMYNITDPRYKNGQDFQMLTWKERALDLHDIHKDPSQSQIVTGVRFRKIGYHLNLEVQFTHYNITTGELLPNNTDWIGNYNTEQSKENPREFLDMEKLDVPTRSNPSLPDSKSNQFIMFTNSDWDKDVAQTTVPFLDAQDVTPRQAVPLSGVGLYHKGRKGFGGFIAPRIFTMDIVDNLKRFLVNNS